MIREICTAHPAKAWRSSRRGQVSTTHRIAPRSELESHSVFQGRSGSYQHTSDLLLLTQPAGVHDRRILPTTAEGPIRSHRAAQSTPSKSVPLSVPDNAYKSRREVAGVCLRMAEEE
eukprot:2112833-Rhodomonas_salina.5